MSLRLTEVLCLYFNNKMFYVIFDVDSLMLTSMLMFTAHLGSVLLINGEQNETYISEIQHVRRRETIAMTPANSLAALKIISREVYFRY